MGVHEAEGELLAIHSVCVDGAHRRRGLATRLLRAYLNFVQATTPSLREARLICKQPLIPLYAGAGFSLLGPSEVVHGKDPWFEMRWAPEEEEEQHGSGGDAAEQQRQQQDGHLAQYGDCLLFPASRFRGSRFGSAQAALPATQKAVRSCRQERGRIEERNSTADQPVAVRDTAAPPAEPAADAAAAAAGADGGGASEEDDSGEWLELPEAQHVLLEPDFLDVAPQLRAHYDERVGNPLRTSSDRFVWDHWHVPGQYNLLRTPASAFFPPELYDRLEDALVEYGERVLGCRGISPVWLSYYVDGCRQGWHSDAPHGPFAFVLSLTRWDQRRFSGGETALLQPWVLDYWRGFDPRRGTETPQLITLVPPLWNQLTVFDGRLPHSVQQVEGMHDPLEARVVLHGWFTQPSPFFAGSLSEEAATPALNACLQGLYAALGGLPPVVGVVTLRLAVEPSGHVADIAWLANTLVARPQGVAAGEAPDEPCQATLATIAEHLLVARFPSNADGGETVVTLPFVFE
ncbi:Oxoglutarate iron-dependent dioxygenase [Micractinium conductrix]|uniref:Oxoglutarate iron-dependent dioxygenase n=1 Tax=Micractinium conductrix TaxID=554055 RepID=A0A2P6V171_9CHLO|nr:Oxoglutarate iron-dependent dioxygenase [Micractinium conductrix]|eukprot:PSC67839.1 Oxoglutarate iron-dependent dioxygenase [Micractinium conductrix]